MSRTAKASRKASRPERASSSSSIPDLLINRFCYDASLLTPLPPEWADKARQLAALDAELNARSEPWKQARTRYLRQELTRLHGGGCRRAWDALPALAAAPLTEQTLLDLYALLMSKAAPGYKQTDNFILHKDKGVVKGILFIPPGADETPGAMADLVAAYQRWEQQGGLPPTAALGCFLLDFLCIHPFPDGNGRMTRLLLVVLLLRMGFSGGQYLCPEGYVQDLRHRTVMTTAQRRSMQGWYEGTNTYQPVAEFWLDAALDLYREALTFRV